MNDDNYETAGIVIHILRKKIKKGPPNYSPKP